jgi:hypothetical protein
MDAGRPGLFADFSDVALAAASANNAGNPPASSVNINAVTNATPTGAHYAAPSALVMAATLFTPKKTGVMLVSFSFGYTTSGAGTIGLLIQEDTTATAVSGGTLVSTWRIDEGATVSLTGGSPGTIATISKTASGAISSDASFSLIISSTINVPVGFQIVLTTAATLSVMNLSAFVAEQL